MQWCDSRGVASEPPGYWNQESVVNGDDKNEDNVRDGLERGWGNVEVICEFGVH